LRHLQLTRWAQFDASKFLGAATAGTTERAKTPTVAMTRLVTTKQAQTKNDSHFADNKQEYEKLIKGLELRLAKKGRACFNVKEIKKVVPKSANHALNILNAAARDEPIKYGTMAREDKIFTNCS
jgi:hypothetical protein